MATKTSEPTAVTAVAVGVGKPAAGRRRSARDKAADPAVAPPRPKAMGNLDIRVMLVTPEQAASWLENNAADNRHQRESKINSYARDMRAGKWQITGDTVKITAEGELIDGQHRMEAVIKADVGVMMVVAFNVPREAMAVIDTGIARTFADSLRNAGVNNRVVISAIVRRVTLWDRNNRMGKGGDAPTHAELLERFEADVPRYVAATGRGIDVGHQKIAPSSIAGTAYFLFSRINEEQAHQFFDSLVSGANLADSDPILTVRNRLMAKGSKREDRFSPSEQLALLVRAWNAFREQRTLDRAPIAKGKLTSANFPTPV